MVNKRGNKAQLTVETLMLFGVILTFITPAIYIVMVKSGEVKSEFDDGKLDDYCSQIVENSEIIYYNGLYSKMTVTPHLDNALVDKAYTLEIQDDYYFVLEVNDSNGVPKKKLFNSNIPMMTNGSCINSTDNSYFSECAVPLIGCRICFLNGSRFVNLPIQIEAVMNDSVLKIKLIN